MRTNIFETDDTVGFEFDLQSILNDGIKRINDAIETHARALFRRAYEAGYERGSDDVAHAERGIGPHEDRPPAFEEFMAELIAEFSP